MPNKQLYKITQQEPISHLAIDRRWQFFGHALRRPFEEPTFHAMHEYYDRRQRYNQDIDHATGIQLEKGRNLNNLPTLLNNDVHFIGDHLQTLADFQRITERAQDRAAWTSLRREIKTQQVIFLNSPRATRKRPLRAPPPRRIKKRRSREYEPQQEAGEAMEIE